MVATGSRPAGPMSSCDLAQVPPPSAHLKLLFAPPQPHHLVESVYAVPRKPFANITNPVLVLLDQACGREYLINSTRRHTYLLDIPRPPCHNRISFVIVKPSHDLGMHCRSRGASHTSYLDVDSTLQERDRPDSTWVINFALGLQHRMGSRRWNRL